MRTKSYFSKFILLTALTPSTATSVAQPKTCRNLLESFLQTASSSTRRTLGGTALSNEKDEEKGKVRRISGQEKKRRIRLDKREYHITHQPGTKVDLLTLKRFDPPSEGVVALASLLPEGPAKGVGDLPST